MKFAVELEYDKTHMLCLLAFHEIGVRSPTALVQGAAVELSL